MIGKQLRYGIYLLGFVLVLVHAVSQSSEPKKITVSNAEELQALFENAVENLIVRLLPGEYHLRPFSGIDSTCGNCEDPETPVEVTIGLRISGRGCSGYPEKPGVPHFEPRHYSNSISQSRVA